MGRDIPMAEDRESKTAGDLSEKSELEPLASESEILALPSTADQASVDGSLILHVDGPATSLLDSMGPVVVHEDGTISRVANWDKMTEEERSRTLRVLGRRNAARLEKLRQGGGSGGADGGGAGSAAVGGST